MICQRVRPCLTAEPCAPDYGGLDFQNTARGLLQGQNWRCFAPYLPATSATWALNPGINCRRYPLTSTAEIAWLSRVVDDSRPDSAVPPDIDITCSPPAQLPPDDHRMPDTDRQPSPSCTLSDQPFHMQATSPSRLIPSGNPTFWFRSSEYAHGGNVSSAVNGDFAPAANVAHLTIDPAPRPFNQSTLDIPGHNRCLVAVPQSPSVTLLKVHELKSAEASFS